MTSEQRPPVYNGHKFGFSKVVVVHKVVFLRHEEKLVKPRRTKAEQEVLALIAPLGKLGCFEEAADFFSS